MGHIQKVCLINRCRATAYRVQMDKTSSDKTRVMKTSVCSKRKKTSSCCSGQHFVNKAFRVFH